MQMYLRVNESRTRLDSIRTIWNNAILTKRHKQFAPTPKLFRKHWAPSCRITWSRRVLKKYRDGPSIPGMNEQNWSELWSWTINGFLLYQKFRSQNNSQTIACLGLREQSNMDKLLRDNLLGCTCKLHTQLALALLHRLSSFFLYE